MYYVGDERRANVNVSVNKIWMNAVMTSLTMYYSTMMALTCSEWHLDSMTIGNKSERMIGIAMV